MGRHAADEGAGRHPIVEDALARRSDGAGRPAAHSAVEGPLGWPGDEHRGTGLGWPQPARNGGSEEPGETVERTGTTEPVVVMGPDTVVVPLRRRGWRRLFGRSTVADTRPGNTPAGTEVPAG